MLPRISQTLPGGLEVQGAVYPAKQVCGKGSGRKDQTSKFFTSSRTDTALQEPQVIFSTSKGRPCQAKALIKLSEEPDSSALKVARGGVLRRTSQDLCSRWTARMIAGLSVSYACTPACPTPCTPDSEEISVHPCVRRHQTKCVHVLG